MADLPRMVVFPHRMVKSLKDIPPSADLSVFPLIPGREALESEYDTDAHCALYDIPGENRIPRLSKHRPALRWLHSQGLEVTLRWIILDIDTPGHEAWTEGTEKDQRQRAAWWIEQLAKFRGTEEGAVAGWYRTRAGYHLVWSVNPPISPDTWERGARVLRAKFRAVGVPCDELKDWTRLFRLPRVLRDGERTNLPMDLSKIGSLDLRSPLALVPTTPKQTPKGDDWSRVRMDPTTESILKNGRPVASPPNQRIPGEPGRDTRILQIAGSLLASMDTPDPAVVTRLMLPSVLASKGDSPQDISTEEKLLDRVQYLTEKEIEKRADQRISGGSTLPEEDPLDGLESRAADADLTQRLALQDPTGRSIYVWDEGRKEYVGPYARSVAIPAMLQRCPVLSAPHVQGERGGYRPADQMLARCGRVVERVTLVLGLDKTRYNENRDHLLLSAAPWAKLTPQWNPDVHRWLEALGGRFPEKLLDWLATIRQVDRPTCALYLHGRKGSGKGLLPLCLAQLWESEEFVTYETATGQSGTGFTEELTRTALVWADEELPRTFRGQTPTTWLRTLVGNTRHRVRRRFLPEVPLEGCFRVIISANNANLLRVDLEDLEPEDLAAVIERIGYIRSEGEPTEILHSLGGWNATARWVQERTVARHVLALEKERNVILGDRFLVPGWRTEFHESLLSSAGVNRQTLTLIAKALACLAGVGDIPWRGDGVYPGGGNLRVNGPLILKAWKIFLPDQRVPADHRFADALRSLSDPDETGRLKRPVRVTVGGSKRQVNCWNIRYTEVLRTADALQIGDTDQMREMIEQ